MNPKLLICLISLILYSEVFAHLLFPIENLDLQKSGFLML
jgi:hypothetical protein